MKLPTLLFALSSDMFHVKMRETRVHNIIRRNSENIFTENLDLLILYVQKQKTVEKLKQLIHMPLGAVA